VTEPEFIRADRKMAVQITINVATGAAAIALTYYLIGRLIT
jgi:hypothetical protein